MKTDRDDIAVDSRYVKYAPLGYNTICVRCDDRYRDGPGKDIEISMCDKCRAWFKAKRFNRRQIFEAEKNEIMAIVFSRCSA